MDSVPSEVTLQILSYLPGHDISRFKRLSKKYGELIVANERHLPLPIVNVKFWEKDEMFFIEVQSILSRRPFRCSFDKSFTRIVMCNREDSSEDFLLPFFEGCHQLTMTSMFSFILENTEVHLLLNTFFEKDIIMELAKAVKVTESRIRSVRTSNAISHNAQLGCLLQIIGERTTRKPGFPLLYYDEPYTPDEWFGLEMINEISALYAKTIFEFDSASVVLTMLWIARAWIRNPTSVFKFSLRVVKEERGDDEYVIRDEIMRNGDEELISVHQNLDMLVNVSPENEPSWIQFIHRRNQNYIRFDKVQERNSQNSEEGDDQGKVEIFISISARLS